MCRNSSASWPRTSRRPTSRRASSPLPATRCSCRVTTPGRSSRPGAPSTATGSTCSRSTAARSRRSASSTTRRSPPKPIAGEGAPMGDLAAIVERARQCWNRGDLPGYLALYDDSIRLHGYAPEPMDKVAVTAFYQAIHGGLGEAGMPPRLLFHEVMTDRDCYACRFTISGAHTGPFMGRAATGRRYSMGGITIMRFAGDRVVERWSCADMLGLMVQLGAVPPPGG